MSNKLSKFSISSRQLTSSDSKSPSIADQTKADKNLASKDNYDITDTKIVPTIQLAIVSISGQNFALPVNKLYDIVKANRIFVIPLAPVDIVGVINFRGRIVTLINTAKIINFTTNNIAKRKEIISFTVENKNELYSFVVDELGDVIDHPKDQILKLPDTTDNSLRLFCAGVIKRQDDFILVFDVDALMKRLLATVSQDQYFIENTGIELSLFENPIAGFIK